MTNNEEIINELKQEDYRQDTDGIPCSIYHKHRAIYWRYFPHTRDWVWVDNHPSLTNYERNI